MVTFQNGLDTGVLLAAEILGRGIAIDYCDLSLADWRQPTSAYLARLPVAQILSVDPSATPAFRVSQPRTANVEEYSVILQRKDPPVDETYIGHARHFSAAPSHIVQMNHPDLTWRFSEHLLPQRYPDFAVPTFLCKSYEEFHHTVRSQKGESVAKPIHFCSGIGIEFFRGDAADADLKRYWEQWQPQVIVQPYLEEVTRSGDLRILVMNHRTVGWVLRKPKPGGRLANLHQGGSAHAGHPSPVQFAAAKAISADLCPKGLYLLGLDFIGDHLTEVNITCPSAVPQINQTMGIHAEVAIIDELEALRKNALSPREPFRPFVDHSAPIR